MMRPPLFFAALALFAPLNTSAQITYHVSDYPVPIWPGGSCHTGGFCLGLSNVYVSAVERSYSAGSSLVVETYYFMGVTGWWRGDLPTSFGSSLTISGLFKDGSSASFHDHPSFKPDGTFAVGGGPHSPCSFFSSAPSLVCGFFGPTYLEPAKRIVRAELEQWTVHDYDTGMTTRCQSTNDPICYAVPETSSWLLMATGVFGLALVGRRRRGRDPRR